MGSQFNWLFSLAIEFRPCALQPALDVGHEGGRYDDDLAAVGGDELEQVVHSLDDLDGAETLLDLGPDHPNLYV